MEVKGVTLEKNNTAMFPDAPTTRGTRHVREMIQAVEKGYTGYIFFLIQMENIRSFTPNKKMDPDFSQAIIEANQKGVKIIAYDSQIKENEIRLAEKVPIFL